MNRPFPFRASCFNGFPLQVWGLTLWECMVTFEFSHGFYIIISLPRGMHCGGTCLFHIPKISDAVVVIERTSGLLILDIARI